MVYQAATAWGTSRISSRGGSRDWGRPYAVRERGVPSADLIDFDYGYNNVFYHTPQDTIDKLSPKSLQIVGSVILETVRMLDSR